MVVVAWAVKRLRILLQSSHKFLIHVQKTGYYTQIYLFDKSKKSILNFRSVYEFILPYHMTAPLHFSGEVQIKKSEQQKVTGFWVLIQSMGHTSCV
jgi:hypothetical protein